MKRVWILGPTGSGKSTLARQLSQKIGGSYIDLDELHWRPDWQVAPESEFMDALERATNAQSWAIAGNYSRMQARFLPRADTIIWLDYSFLIVFGRLLKRTWRRVVWGEPCCNANRESWGLVLSRDSIILWLFRTYYGRRHQNWKTRRRARRLGIRFIRFRHPCVCRMWLTKLAITL